MKRIFFLALLLVLLGAATSNASWLIFHKPEFIGKVVDIDTKEPIGGAVVVAIYRTHVLALGDSANLDIYAQEALTDKDGKFIIPSYTTLINPLSWSNPVRFIIFKPGYVCDGLFELEDELSGSGARSDREYSASWNQNLKYQILKSGVIMLRKVTGKDRIESSRKLSPIAVLKGLLPIASAMKFDENKYITTQE